MRRSLMRRSLRRSALALLVSGLGAATAPAWAAEPASKYDPQAAFAEADTNHDGVIDHEEFQERIIEVFYRADRNKDGFLDAEERKVLVFPNDFKTDAEGRVSLREFLRVRFHDYDATDTDHDGVLSLPEVTATYEAKRIQ